MKGAGAGGWGREGSPKLFPGSRQLPTPLCPPVFLFFNFLIFNLFLFLGCVGSLLLPAGFSLVATRGGATLPCGAWASHCGSFSCCGAQTLARGLQYLQCTGSVVAAPQL